MLSPVLACAFAFTSTAFLSCALALPAFAGEPAAHADRVTSLPGLPADLQSLGQWAGYLNATNGQRANELFYWLVERPDSPEDAPLVLWLQVMM